mmetsp:Transcript_43707/g.130552  ORF Transcript_43707/g.130552 Transcript_43707/m.130552 type:complete len:241 (-) Transcript_43707:876-1598(-)
MPPTVQNGHLAWREAHDLHAALDVACVCKLRVQVDGRVEVLGAHRGLLRGDIGAARADLYLIGPHVFQCRRTCDDDQVRPRQPGAKLILDRLEQDRGELVLWLVVPNHKSVVVGPVLLRRVHDARPIAAPAVVRRAEGSRTVPGEAHEERTVMVEVCAPLVIAEHGLHFALDLCVVHSQRGGRHLGPETGLVSHVTVHELRPGLPKVLLQLVAVPAVCLQERPVDRILPHVEVCHQHHNA